MLLVPWIKQVLFLNRPHVTDGNADTHVSEDDAKVQLVEARSLRHLAIRGLQGIFTVINPKEPMLQLACSQRKIRAMASHQSKQKCGERDGVWVIHIILLR